MRGLRLDVGRGRKHVAFAVRIAFLIGTGQAQRPIAHVHVIAAHEAVGIERVAVGRITQREIVGLHAGADGLNPPAAHVVRHRGGMVLDLIGGVARKVGCKRLDARDDAKPRHGIDRVAHLVKRRAIVKQRVDEG